MHTSTIKAFDIDFNWDWLGQPASPGLYVQADPEEHIRWYADLGVNTIQVFCVSYNGYAWYPSKTVPQQPGLKGDFLGRMVELGHRRGMKVMGYFCLGANPRWENEHRNLFHSERQGSYRIPMTEEYLDFFCESVRDALTLTGMDGFMIDWFNVPRRSVWLECEKRMYEQLMGETFPADRLLGTPVPVDFDRTALLPEGEQLEFDRRALERAWRRISDAVKAVRPAIIWTNHPFRRPDDPLWTGHPLLKEVDWVLNEGPDIAMLGWLEKQVGPKTRIIQNLCGWGDHDAGAWRKMDPQKFGFYGFAQADPATTLPATGGVKTAPSLQRNIAILREAYREMPG
jgi:hypothetical protein